MLLGIHHAAIICSNYQKSKHFYVTILGLSVLAEHYREARQSYKLDLQLPDMSQIELFSFDNPPKRPSYPEACGLRHLAFRVESLKRRSNILRPMISPSNLSALTNTLAKSSPSLATPTAYP